MIENILSGLSVKIVIGLLIIAVSLFVLVRHPKRKLLDALLSRKAFESPDTENGGGQLDAQSGEPPDTQNGEEQPKP
jgi:hypothetical protein